MSLGSSGIGWLIFGVLVCASSTEAEGVPAKLSTIALGLVFVATYLIKNWFDPRYKALFIIGGTFIAFSIENGRDEATMIALCISAVCLFIFYLVNKEVINAWLGGASITEYPYDEDYEEYICDAAMDEDDYNRLRENAFKGCPYYRDGDEYRVVRKQL